jgi:hypothetical protein
VNTLYLIWHSYVSQEYILLGKLVKTDNKYLFYNNVEGALKAKNEGCFLPFEINEPVIRSNNLFSFFQNRIMSLDREDIHHDLKSLNLGKYDEFEILKASEGIKVGDNFCVVTFEKYEQLKKSEEIEKRNNHRR